MANADQRKLKQIIYNLLSNALKFTPKNGKVHVQVKEVKLSSRRGLRQNDSMSTQIIKKVDQGVDDAPDNLQRGVEVSISDTGIGLNPDDLNRIFNRFEQIDGSKGRSYTGAGLGLALTKALVELHGGAIKAESAGVGEGCTFTVIFPL